MKTVKIRSDMGGVSVANPYAKTGYCDGTLVAAIQSVPDSISSITVADRFRKTLINSKDRCVFSFKELGLNKIVF